MAKPKRKQKTEPLPRRECYCPACGVALTFEAEVDEPIGSEFLSVCPGCGAALASILLPVKYGGWSVFTKKRFDESQEYLQRALADLSEDREREGQGARLLNYWEARASGNVPPMSATRPV